jgi:hypothetical protein
MIPSLAVLVGLLQAAGHPVPARAPRAPDPVRVWRADSIAYVKLRDPGYVTLLYVDGVGRILVLYPLVPDDPTIMSTDALVALDLPPEAQGNPATLVAVRSRWPFDFASLRLGSWWDYQNALLLQPTAGDPLAAILDIAERVTGGRPYDYGEVTYSPEGTVVARGPVRQPDVCLSCVRHGTPVAAVPAAANSVDCSNASLTNSFCGVNSGSVSITSTPAPAPQPQQVVYQPAPEPVYVPYVVPFGHGMRRRFEPRPVAPPVAPRSQGVAYPIAPRLVVPSPSQLRTLTGRHR